jgi:hypothetical protein
MLHKSVREKEEVIALLEEFIERHKPLNEIKIDYDEAGFRVKLLTKEERKKAVLETQGVYQISRDVLEEILNEENFYEV